MTGYGEASVVLIVSWWVAAAAVRRAGINKAVSLCDIHWSEIRS